MYAIRSYYEAFLADGRILHVSSDSDDLQADYELGASLLAFHIGVDRL